MHLKHFLLPVIAVCLGGSLQAQTLNTSPSPSPSPGFGKQGGGWHHHHEGWLFRKLQLTDEQRQALKTYRTNNQTAFRSALLATLQAKAALQSAISQNNTGNLAGLASNLATAQTQLIQLRAQREAYIASILSPEQKNIWSEIQNKKAARLQDRINDLQGQTNS
jgi:Spy/CpxP family protein refolding chaperone